MSKFAGDSSAALNPLALERCDHGGHQQAVTGVTETSPTSAAIANVASAYATDGNYVRQVTAVAAKPLTFRGWLLTASRQPAGKFSLVLAGKKDYVIPTPMGVSGPGVGAHLKKPKFSSAGFALVSVLESVSPGDYKFALLVNRVKSASLCEAKRR